MARWIHRPIVVWPGELTRSRRPSPFKAEWSATVRLLEDELRHIGGKDVVLQRAFSEEDLRLDGEPRAGARALHPGVILSFDSRFGPLRYATDAFENWEANLRAIALSLEALRAVDRYGVSRRGEQYVGWKALPDGRLSKAEARKWVEEHGGSIAAALKETHPDHGGSAADLQRTLEARRILDPGIPPAMQP
jgi:hypothetical protein